MREFLNLSYGGGERNVLDLFLPDEEASDLLIFFHGGGMESGGKEDVKHLQPLLDQGIALAFPNYRLYPHAHYPEFIEDAALACAWVLKNRGQWLKPGRTFAGGSSAGAYLIQMLCFDAKYLGAHGLSPSFFNGFISSGGQPTVHFNVLRESGLPQQAVVIDERAPIYHVREPQGRPQVLLLAASDDIPGRVEQTAVLLSAMKAFGWGVDLVQYHLMEGYAHCAYEGEPVFREMLLDFMRSEGGQNR